MVHKLSADWRVRTVQWLSVVACFCMSTASAQISYDYPSPSFLPGVPVPAAPTAQRVPLSKSDCNLLAARKQWTGIKTCNPPPKCPVEDVAGKSYQTKKGPFWCNNDGQVTILRPGTLPSAWGYFPALRILTVLGNDKLKGRVPGSFSLLATLSELDLGYNPNLKGGIPADLAASDTLSRLRVAGSGIRAKQHQFNRKNFNGNPLLLIVSRSRPEICEDYKNGYPVLVQAVYWSASKKKYVGATLPKC